MSEKNTGKQMSKLLPTAVGGTKNWHLKKQQEKKNTATGEGGRGDKFRKPTKKKNQNAPAGSTKKKKGLHETCLLPWAFGGTREPLQTNEKTIHSTTRFKGSHG